MQIHTFKTKDHPTANGRRPLVGESCWAFSFPLENGDEVRIEMGREGRANLRAVLISEMLGEEGLPPLDGVDLTDSRAGDAGDAKG